MANYDDFNLDMELQAGNNGDNRNATYGLGCYLTFNVCTPVATETICYVTTEVTGCPATQNEGCGENTVSNCHSYCASACRNL